MIFGLSRKSITFLKSTAGSEFVYTMAIVPSLSKYEKLLRQHLLYLKKGDFVGDDNRSVFFSIVF